MDRDGLSSSTQLRGNAEQGVESRYTFDTFLAMRLIPFPDPLRLSDIRTLYPNFESLFQKHVKNARFDAASRRNPEFKALKIGVISLWHLQEKHGHLRPVTRSALVQALLVEHNVHLAFRLIEDAEKNFNQGSSTVTPIVSSWPGSMEEEYFKTKMKTAAANLPDSQFLPRLENTDDKDLRSTVQNAKALAYKELSRSIDTAVNNMTHAILTIQRDHGTRIVQVELDKEERNVIRDALVEFVREINKKSAGQRNS